MAVIYNAAIKNARMQVTLTAYDADALPATMEIGTAGMAAVLAIVTLQDPSFSLAGAVLTLLGVPLSSAPAIGAGTAAEARIKDGGGTVCVSGLTVGIGGTDVIVSSTTIAINDVVRVDSGTITHG
jgi:hypothetical protein